MQKIETDIEGLYVIQLETYSDNRGFFVERYNREKFKKIGINEDFVQDNHSRSYQHVIRGLHAQKGQGKLVGSINGSIYDVAVDIRPESKTFGKFFGIELSDKNGKLLWVPDGFLHGFQVISEIADVTYKVTALFNPDAQFAVCWNDIDIKINWPAGDRAILNERDANAPRLREINELK